MYPILIYPDFKLSAKIPRTPKREAWREGGGPAAVRSAPRAPWPVRGAAPNRGTGRAQRERPPARLTQSRGCAARGRAHPMRGASSASIQVYNSYIESRVSACLYTCTVLPVFPLKLNISRPLPEFVKSIRGFEAGRRGRQRVVRRITAPSYAKKPRSCPFFFANLIRFVRSVLLGCESSHHTSSKAIDAERWSVTARGWS